MPLRLVVCNTWFYLLTLRLTFFSIRQQFNHDKEALITNGKLLVAMGLPWTIEILQGVYHHFDDKNNNSGFAHFLWVLNNINAFMVSIDQQIRSVHEVVTLAYGKN